MCVWGGGFEVHNILSLCSTLKENIKLSGGGPAQICSSRFEIFGGGGGSYSIFIPYTNLLTIVRVFFRKIIWPWHGKEI